MHATLAPHPGRSPVVTLHEPIPPGALRFVTKAEAPPGDDPTEFVMSDGSVDRMGDVIEPDGWKLVAFRKNPVALFGHDTRNPIGTWKNVRVEKGRLLGSLVLAERGTSPFIDTLHGLIAQRILRAVSVGFLPLKSEPLDDEDDFWGPVRFLEQELLECSLVAVPANANALVTAKAMHLPPDMMRAFFSAPANETRTHSERKPGATAVTPPVPKGAPMNTLSQRIESARTTLVTYRDQLAALAEKEQRTDQEEAQCDQLQQNIDALHAQLDKDVAREQSIARAGTPVGSTVAAPAILAPAGSRSIVLPKKLAPREYLARGAACHFIAKATGRTVDQVVQDLYSNDEPTRAVLRAAMAPAMTTVAGWAAELVQQSIGDFIDNLPRNSIYPALAAAGLKFTFGRNGSIKLPARSATPKINGSFVGEGQPIPVRKLGLTSITLTPKKMAVISEFTREMAAHSTPAIEGVIRQAINEDTSEAIDTALIDAVAADAIRPAGLRNGIAAIPASAALATVFETMVKDLTNLINAIVGARGGRNLILLCNPAQQLALSWVVLPGIGFVFNSVDEGTLRNLRVIASITVPAKTLILVDAADFASATGDVPEFDVSDVATLHEEDTTPLPIVGGTAQPPVLGSVAAPVRSLWQTASIGVRMLLDMNWAMRRTGMVAWTENTNW